MSNIKLLRLISGEEVIGDVEHKLVEVATGLLEPAYTVKDPAALRWVPSEEDPKVPKLILVSLIPHAEEDVVTLHERHVLFEITPITELLNEYNSVLGSGIVAPNKKGLTL